MRVFLNILFWGFTSSLFLGLYLKERFANDISEILIGFSVLALSLCIYHCFYIIGIKVKTFLNILLTIKN